MKKVISLALVLSLALLCPTLMAQRYNWTKPEELNRGLPGSVEIFTLNMKMSPNGLPLTGAFARFDMKDENLEFIVRDENGD